MSKMLDLLLKSETENMQKQLPTAKYRVKRLSEAVGEDVIFTLRALPYGRIAELRDAGSDELSIQIVLQGTVEPNLKDEALLKKFDAATPAEAVKALLLPGEIEDLSMAIERLCGYRRSTIDEVKNA